MKRQIKAILSEYEVGFYNDSTDCAKEIVRVLQHGLETQEGFTWFILALDNYLG